MECKFWAQVLITTPSYWINRCFHFAVVIATWAEFGTPDCRMLHFSSCNSYLNRNLQLSPLWIWIFNIRYQMNFSSWISTEYPTSNIKRPFDILFITSIWISNIQYQSTVGYLAKFYVECEFWAQVLITTPSYWINRCFHFVVVIATWGWIWHPGL